MKKLIITQFFVLLVGAIFAWVNFGLELSNWLQKKVCTTGCAVGINPFLTPCFYGACFFAVAFVLSAILLWQVSKK